MEMLGIWNFHVDEEEYTVGLLFCGKKKKQWGKAQCLLCLLFGLKKKLYRFAVTH
jgi:hypothetical protein